MEKNIFCHVNVGINLSPSCQKIFNEVYPDPFTGKYGLAGTYEKIAYLRLLFFFALLHYFFLKIVH